ncbi:MAG: hypothetical protein Q9166_007785 [cf. Caloplaca sp. 2 TL-2023]
MFSSLHAKASAVVPDLKTKPSTILVAILHTDKDPNGIIRQEDFLWVKCHARISLTTIHAQYENKREGNSPWELKHDGKPVDLHLTVGDIKEVDNFDNHVVVFQAAITEPAGQAPSSHNSSGHAATPLSPKDANPRLRPAPILPKPTSPSNNDENAPPAASPAGNDRLQRQIRPSPGPDDTVRYHAHYDRLSTNSPRQTPTPNAWPIPPHPYSQPFAHAPQQPSAAPSVPRSPYVKVEQGAFPLYRDSGIRQCRLDFPGEPDELLDRRLWTRWLGMTESERSIWTPTQGSASVKTEVTPLNYLTPPIQTPAASSSIQHIIPATQTDEYGQKHFQLSAMLRDAAPQLLESAVEASVKLLDTLKAPLVDKMANSPDAEHWIQQIENLKKQAVKTKTVIGVVGNTGAGKSSVINAMLEEERLVPTNCMRACTAVVTEISYNYEEQPYCAEIEFITAEDWAKELKVLFQDLLDGEGNVSRECTNEDSDAGVAYAKIKAVYPQKTKEDISRSSIQRMLQDVSHILGTKRNIKENDALKFYKTLQSFVDSKEKSTGKKDKDGKKQKKERELWPLIRVVRLYVKSPALKTGAVIVDLPGVHDANAARAAVAEGYMKQCTGLWIVAPINRAVDDKAAKSLLGESFKRQLKMDGGFSAVTFICSKTDDISISEAQDSLGLDDKMGPSWEELEHLSAKQKDLKKQLKEQDEIKAIYEETANDIDEEIEVWETLQESVSNGKVAFAPKTKSSKKRKTGSTERLSKKKKRKVIIDDEDDADFIDDDSEDSDKSPDSDEEASDHDSQDQQALTEEQVTTKLQELKATKKDARAQKRELTEKMQDIRKELEEIEDAESTINSELSALCISGRNQYSKGAIQQDFAAGIREIDQEIAAEEDEDNFNPDNEVRDYDEVAKSLPVFCVSSRGYQKLQGRLRKDPPVPGFTTVEETEIPALQAHVSLTANIELLGSAADMTTQCEKLTETGRTANCRAFINRLGSLLNSLTIWASSDGTGANLTAEQKAKEARFLQKGMEGLETRLENITKSCAQALNDEFQDAIFDRYEAAIQAASFDSVPTATHWGAPVNRENRAAGGLFWASYKAVCRRDGVFTNAQGLHDWNAQLIEPMIKLIAPGWEKVFTRRIQSVMTNFTKTIPAVLKKFHRDIEDRARKIGTGLGSLSMLSHQITVYEQILKDLAANIKDVIVAAQKDINREFGPVLQRAMQPSYEWCEAERGPGQYKRMKAYMIDHVEQNRDTMFRASADQVRRLLKDLVKDVEEQIADKTDEVFIQIKRDYRSVLGGGEVSQGEVLPRVQRQVRKEIKKTIDGVERMMKIVIGLEVDDPADVDQVQKEGAKSEDEDDDGDKVMKSEGEDMPASGSIDDVKQEAANPGPPWLQPSDTLVDTDEKDVRSRSTEHLDPEKPSSQPEEGLSMDVSNPNTLGEGSSEAQGSEDDEGEGNSEDSDNEDGGDGDDSE